MSARVPVRTAYGLVCGLVRGLVCGLVCAVCVYDVFDVCVRPVNAGAVVGRVLPVPAVFGCRVMAVHIGV